MTRRRRIINAVVTVASSRSGAGSGMLGVEIEARPAR